MIVPGGRAEEARARMIALVPAGFEEIDRGDAVELVAYTDRDVEAELSRVFGGATARDVEPGWEDRWREFHRPVRVGRLWIGQPWHVAPADGVCVVIDPGRAFGTGAHPSTRLCLELLQRVGVGSLLDVGCGSGVIAIAAARLGFDPVTAVDADEHAIEATVRNAAANNVAVQAFRADADTAPLPPTDVAVVNVARALIERIVPRLRCRIVIAAGHLRGDELELRNFRRAERVDEEDWAADLLERVAQ